MEKAREFYVNSVGVGGPVKQPVILRLIQSVSADVDKFKKEESNLPADDGNLFYFYFFFVCLSQRVIFFIADLLSTRCEAPSLMPFSIQNNRRLMALG